MATKAYPYASSLRESFRELFREEYTQQGREEGRAELLETQRDAVRLVVKARGFKLTSSQAKLIDDCTDPDTLKAWATAAVTAAAVDDIFR